MSKTTQTAQTRNTMRGDALADFLIWLASWLGKIALLLVGPFWLLWWGCGYLNPDQLRWLLAGVAWLLVPVLLLGMDLGKTEARGLIAGIDAGLTKLAGAVDLRDNSRARAATQRQALTAKQPTPQAAQYNIYLPDPAALAGAVPITHRQLAGSDVIDL